MQINDLTILKSMKRRKNLFNAGILLLFLAIFVVFFFFLYSSATSLSKSVIGETLYQERLNDAYKYSLIIGIIFIILYLFLITINSINIGRKKLNELNGLQIQEMQEVLPKKILPIWKKGYIAYQNVYANEELKRTRLVFEYNQKTVLFVTKYFLFIDRGTRFQIVALRDIQQIKLLKMKKLQYVQKEGYRIINYKIIMNSGKTILISTYNGLIDFVILKQVINYYNPYVEMINERME